MPDSLSDVAQPIAPERVPEGILPPAAPAAGAPDNPPPAPARTSRLRVYGALALGILCIGLSAIFVKWAAMPGTVSAFYRIAIGSVVLALPFARGVRRGRVAGGLGLWALTLLAGVFFALDIAVWNTSLQVTSAANATLLGNDAPLVVGLGALLIFRERLRLTYWLGLVVALCGMSLIVGWDVLSRSPLGAGDLLALLAGVFYGGYLLATQRIRARMDTLSSLWIASLAGTGLLLAFNLTNAQPLWGFTPGAYLALLGLGLISQVAGWLAINYALGHLPAAVVSVTLLGQPVLTAALAVPLLGEALESRQILGGLVALGGIALVNLGVARSNK
jgi:drug/metabolite transporter (DMT)-like permease